jgi:hypothetical protein
VVGAEQLQSLPVLDRNFMVLAQLLPGTGPYSGSKFAVTKFGGVADQRNGYTTIIAIAAMSMMRSGATRPST